MAFTSRSKRKCEISQDLTDYVCGPGTYNLRKEYSVEPNHVGFSSSCSLERNPLPPSSQGPGPGEYLQ
eukprot:5739608-Ditylum_brightwellii.AAC.1